MVKINKPKPFAVISTLILLALLLSLQPPLNLAASPQDGALSTSRKQVNVSQTMPLSVVSYRITLKNTGQTTIDPLTATDALPPQITFVPGSLQYSAGSANFSVGVITWTGSLPAGSKVIITFDASVNSGVPLGTEVTNTAQLSGGAELEDISATFYIGGKPCGWSDFSGNPVLMTGGGWDNAAVWNPSVVKVGSDYKMWYSGSDGTITSIGYATSTDGANWVKYAGNPVLSSSLWWEGMRVSNPNVIYDGGVYKMWYTGRDGSGVLRIGYATSPDAIVWTKVVDPVLSPLGLGSFEADDIYDSSVVKAGTTYHMWYTGISNNIDRIGHAVSSDGISWTRDPSGFPVLDLGAPGGWDWLDVYSPNVIQVGNQFLMWYSGATLPEKYQIGTAVSNDGINWARQGMFIPQLPWGGIIDLQAVDFPSAIVDGNAIKIWYSGYHSPSYMIGYAGAGLCPVAAPLGETVYLPLSQNDMCTAPYYQDPFTDPASGWPIYDDVDVKSAYTGGEYQIQGKTANSWFITTPGALVTDFTALVTTRRVSGDGYYGLAFGINGDFSQFYEIDFLGNQYSVWRFNNGWVTLKNWTTSSFLGGASSANRLKVVRQGDNILIYANNHYLTTVVDSSFTGLRRVGLVAGAGNQSTDVRFDNFSMYPPNCAERSNLAIPNNEEVLSSAGFLAGPRPPFPQVRPGLGGPQFKKMERPVE